jgi:ribose/xylose/arabinose/galactoside ABC-type transport system permease subunit
MSERISLPPTGAALAGAALRRGVYVLLVLLCVAGAVASPGFRTAENLINVLRSVSLVGIAALGVSFVTLAGSFVDLSVAGAVSISAVVSLRLAGVSSLLALAAALGAGLAIGAVNGVLVGRFRANAILLTLATQTILGGLLLIATGGQVTYGSSRSLLVRAADASVGRIPVVVIVLAALTAACQLALSHTTWGHRLTAVGENERTALFAGLRPDAVWAQAFVLAGLFAGITGALLAGTTAAATPTVGNGYEFDAFTAVVIGGTRLTGGRGSAVGTLTGALLVGVLSNLLVLSGTAYSLQQVAKGAVLIIAVGLDITFGRSRG